MIEWRAIYDALNIENVIRMLKILKTSQDKIVLSVAVLVLNMLVDEENARDEEQILCFCIDLTSRYHMLCLKTLHHSS